MFKKFVLSSLAACSLTSFLFVSLPTLATTSWATKSQTSTKSTMSMSNSSSQKTPTTSTSMKQGASSEKFVSLQVGSKGERVESLQNFLKKKGFYSSSINGTFDSKTRTAVIAFQQKEHLKPDGIVGIKTQAAIDKAN